MADGERSQDLRHLEDHLTDGGRRDDADRRLRVLQHLLTVVLDPHRETTVRLAHCTDFTTFGSIDRGYHLEIDNESRRENLGDGKRRRRKGLVLREESLQLDAATLTGDRGGRVFGKGIRLGDRGCPQLGLEQVQVRVGEHRLKLEVRRVNWGGTFWSLGLSIPNSWEIEERELRLKSMFQVDVLQTIA